MTRKIKNSWWVDFRVEGTRYRKRSPINTERAAKEYESALRQRVVRGEPLTAKAASHAPTFADFSAHWFKTYAVANNKPSTQWSKDVILRNHLVPAFGKFRLDAITGDAVEQYKVAKRAGGLCAKTVNGHLAVLARCLRSGVEWGAFRGGPAIRLLKTAPPPFKFLTREQSAALIAHVHPAWRAMVLLALRTGLRIGELRALRWIDVNLPGKHLMVRRAVVKNVVSTPKNNRERLVPLTDDALDVLGTLTREHELVFHNLAGEYVPEVTCTKALHRQFRRAGLPPFGWHTLRHTFATQLACAGVPLHVIQNLLGHSTIHMTLRYAHVMPSAVSGALAVLNQVWATPPAPPLTGNPWATHAATTTSLAPASGQTWAQ